MSVQHFAREIFVLQKMQECRSNTRLWNCVSCWGNRPRKLLQCLILFMEKLPLSTFWKMKTKPIQGIPQLKELTKTLKKINVLLHEHFHPNNHQICDMSGMSWSSNQRNVFKDLHKRRIAAKIFPRLLTNEQQEEIFWDSKSALRPWIFSTVITGDKSWCYRYDTPSNRSNERSCPKKASQMKSNINTMLDIVSSISEVLCKQCLFLRVKL